MKLVANAEVVCEGRKAETQGQHLVSDCKQKAEALVTSGVFHDVAEESTKIEHAYPEGLTDSPQLKAFLKASGDTLELLQKLKADRSVPAKIMSSWMQSWQDDNVKVWEAVKDSFAKMYRAQVSVAICDCLDAFDNDGICSQDCEVKGLIDLSAQSRELHAAQVLDSELLKLPIAKESKVFESISAEVENGKVLIGLITLILCGKCQKIAALYEVDSTSASLEAYMGLVDGAWFRDIRSATPKTVARFVELASSHVRLLQKARSGEVLKQITAIMDGLMDGSCQTLKQDQLIELCAKMPADCEYHAFISSFLKIGAGVGGENTRELLAVVEATIEELATAQASLSPEVVASDFGSDRLTDRAIFLYIGIQITPITV